MRLHLKHLLIITLFSVNIAAAPSQPENWITDFESQIESQVNNWILMSPEERTSHALNVLLQDRGNERDLIRMFGDEQLRDIKAGKISLTAEHKKELGRLALRKLLSVEKEVLMEWRQVNHPPKLSHKMILLGVKAFGAMQVIMLTTLALNVDGVPKASDIEALIQTLRAMAGFYMASLPPSVLDELIRQGDDEIRLESSKRKLIENSQLSNSWITNWIAWMHWMTPEEIQTEKCLSYMKASLGIEKK